MLFQKYKYILLLLTGLIVNLPAMTLETNTTAQVFMLVNTCVGCHGTDSMMASALEYFVLKNDSEESLEELIHFYGSQQ